MIQAGDEYVGESASHDTLQSADTNLNRINDMLKEVLSDIESGKRRNKINRIEQQETGLLLAKVSQ